MYEEWNNGMQSLAILNVLWENI